MTARPTRLKIVERLSEASGACIGMLFSLPTDYLGKKTSLRFVRNARLPQRCAKCVILYRNWKRNPSEHQVRNEDEIIQLIDRPTLSNVIGKRM